MKIYKNPHFGLIVALTAYFFTSFTGPAAAQDLSAEEAKRKINFASRQRMLSQQMSKAACFIAVGIEKDIQLVALASSHELFASTHVALRFGSAEMGLSKELVPSIQASLSHVDEAWMGFTPLIEGILAKGHSATNNLEAIDDQGLHLLGVSNKAVGNITRIYSEKLDDLPLILSTTLDLAGRQRMFTQKMSKEFCLVDAGINIDDNRASLKQTQELFNLTLTSLVDGFPGMVLAAPNDEIRTQLAAVSTLWQPINAIFDSIAAGGEITDQDRLTVARDVGAVLKAMHEAVGMYEAVELGQ